MPFSILTLALLAQVTAIPLDAPNGNDDGALPFAASFLTGGGTWLLPHTTGTIVEFDMNTLSAVRSVSTGELVRNTGVSPDSSKVFIERSFGRVTLHDYPSLAQIAEVNDAGDRVDQFLFNSTSTLGLMVRLSGGVSVIDLTNGDILRSFAAPSLAPGSGGIHSGLAADDQTYVTVGENRVRAYDISLGQSAGSVGLGTDRKARQILLNDARTRAYVVVLDRTTGSPRIDIDVFDLPSLSLVSSTPTTFDGFPIGFAPAFSIDAAETRAALSSPEGAFAIDLATGAATRLSELVTSDSAISVDGQTIAVTADTRMSLFDAGNGQLLDSAVAQVAPFPRFTAVERHPSRPLFIASNGRDRLEIAERGQGSSITFTDINSGFGVEVDGAASVVDLTDSERVAVLHSGSDQVSVVDIGLAAATGRIDVEREPLFATRLPSGAVAVAHGRGASLVTVDTDTLVVTGRVDLLGRATALAAVPGSSRVWVQTVGASGRALELVDTLTMTVLSTTPLVAQSTDYPTQPDIAFDMQRSRAFAVNAATGQLQLVDLGTGTVTAAAAFTGGAAAQALVDPGGARVTVTSSSAEARSWIVSGGSLTLDWTYTCTPDSGGATSNAAGHISVDGTRVILASPGVTGAPAAGGCARSVTLDTSNGQVVATSSDNGWPISSRMGTSDERLRLAGSQLNQTRFNGEAFELANTTSSLASTFPQELTRSEQTGRTYGPGTQSTSIGSFEEVLLVVDPLLDRRVTACFPSVQNSAGMRAALDVQGGGIIGGAMVATVSRLQPGSMTGFLVVATDVTAPQSVVNSQGLLCLGGQLGRYVNQVQQANAFGQHRFEIDLDALPLSVGMTTAVAGDTWAFQGWYRDMTSTGAATSNFSTAMAVEIR